MKFKYKCPSCKATEKIVEKCKKCWKYCCSECSINGFCIDCYVNSTAEEEKKVYLKEKLECLIKTY